MAIFSLLWLSSKQATHSGVRTETQDKNKDSRAKERDYAFTYTVNGA